MPRLACQGGHAAKVGSSGCSAHLQLGTGILQKRVNACHVAVQLFCTRVTLDSLFPVSQLLLGLRAPQVTFRKGIISLDGEVRISDRVGRAVQLKTHVCAVGSDLGNECVAHSSAGVEAPGVPVQVPRGGSHAVEGPAAE